MSKGKLSIYSFYPLFAAFVWGMGFVAQIFASGAIEPFFYNAVRFTLGGIVLIPLIFIADKNRKENCVNSLLYGFLTGVILFSATSFQQIGLTLTKSAAKGGFFTALYAVLVPFLEALLFRKKFPKTVWLAAILSFLGLYCIFISSEGAKSLLNVTKGDVLLLINAFCYSFHIIYIDKVIDKVSPVLFAVTQFLTVGLCSAILCALTETPTLDAVKTSLIPILYGGIASVGCGYTLQIFSQKSRTPVLTSLLFSSESLFALLGGVIILGEKLTFFSLSGCLLILLSIILIQMIQARHK